MGLSVARSITKLIAFDIDQGLSGQADTTISIPLTRSDWETGYLTMWATDTRPRRRSISAVLTRDVDEAYDQVVKNRVSYMPRGYVSYVIDNWDYAGFSYATNNVLSTFSYGYYGRYVRFKSVKINGSNMDLVFYNYRTLTENLKMTGVVRLSRKKLK